MAAEGEIVSAMLALGILYDKGAEGVPSNVPKALYWYTEAAMKNNPEAMAGIGVLHISGRLDEKNYIKGYLWLHQASTIGNTDRHKDLMNALWEQFSDEKKNAIQNILKEAS